MQVRSRVSVHKKSPTMEIYKNPFHCQWVCRLMHRNLFNGSILRVIFVPFQGLHSPVIIVTMSCEGLTRDTLIQQSCTIFYLNSHMHIGICYNKKIKSVLILGIQTIKIVKQ